MTAQRLNWVLDCFSVMCTAVSAAVPISASGSFQPPTPASAANADDDAIELLYLRSAAPLFALVLT